MLNEHCQLSSHVAEHGPAPNIFASEQSQYDDVEEVSIFPSTRAINSPDKSASPESELMARIRDLDLPPDTPEEEGADRQCHPCQSFPETQSQPAEAERCPSRMAKPRKKITASVRGHITTDVRQNLSTRQKIAGMLNRFIMCTFIYNGQ